MTFDEAILWSDNTSSSIIKAEYVILNVEAPLYGRNQMKHLQ